MKILVLGAGNNPHTLKWVNEYAENGHEVHLVYIKNHAPTVHYLDKDVKKHVLFFGGRFSYYLNSVQLNRIVNSVRPDAINVHYASGYGTLARLAKVKRTILSVWGSDVYDFPYKNKYSLKVIRKNLKYADVISSTSYVMAEQIKNVLDNKKYPVTVIPFGVNLDEYIYNNNRKNKDKIIIGNIKSLKPVYGIENLVEAIKILKEQRGISNIQVRLFGDGPSKDSIDKLIKSYKLESYVILEGRIPHEKVPKELSNFDIFCATSLIVNKNDPNEIATALLKLISSKELRKSFGEAGYKRVVERYQWKDNYALMETVLNSFSKRHEREN